MSFSPLARQVTPYKRGPSRGRPVYGLCVHMPGRTIVEQAINLGRDPLDHVVEYYRKPASYSPTYVMGYRGLPDLVQLADERHVMQHVGMAKDGVNDYAALASRAWQAKVSPVASTRWVDVWSRWGKKTPTDLYPGSSPNRAYIGLEVLPLLSARADGLWYTPEQHDGVAALYADICARNGLRFIHGNLVGHEDVNPIRRTDAGGGWDPGALRATPRFDWHHVMREVGGER